MSPKMKITLAFSLLLYSTTALRFNPEPTAFPAHNLHAHDIDPRPTAPPSLKDLRRRQLESIIPGLIIAPDNTCGYQDGNISQAVGWLCPSGRCAFATTAGQTGDMYCCDKGSGPTASCEKRWTRCVDSASSSVVCTGGTNCDTIQTAICSDPGYPYCHRAIFSEINVSVLYCDSTKFTSNDIYDTTYSGEQGVIFTPLTTSTSSTSSTSSSTTTSTSSSSSSSSSQTSTPVPPSKPPIGAIVGGTVGGVAVIALIIAAVFFILRSKKRNSNPEVVTHPPPFVQDQSYQAQYNSPPQEKTAPAFQNTYVPPTYTSQPGSPHQPYSPTNTSTSPLQSHPQQFAAHQANQAFPPQELTSNTIPTSPRPDSTISTNSVPTYQPYQPYQPPLTEENVHEVQ